MTSWFLVLQFTQVFKFGPHVQRGCAWEAVHFATPGLAEKTPVGWILIAHFPLCEADVSMVRVNLSDSAQVQDLIVKIVDCLEIFLSFWRGCKHRQTIIRYNQIMSKTSRWRHLGCSSCKGESFLVHRCTQCRMHHCTEMAMPVLVTCIATVFFWGFAPPAGHSDIGVIAIWLCKCHFDGRKYAKSLYVLLTGGRCHFVLWLGRLGQAGMLGGKRCDGFWKTSFPSSTLPSSPPFVLHFELACSFVLWL